MPDAIWIDRSDELVGLAQQLESQPSIGVDTEFLRERTFFPKLCLLQLSAGGRIWCVDTLRVGSLEPLMRDVATAGAMGARARRRVLDKFSLDAEARAIAGVYRRLV